MSTPLITLGWILALFALILIPLMMYKPRSEEQGSPGAEQRHGKKLKKKKKR